MRKLYKGYVKWFNNEDGIGWITVDGMEDIFIHFSEILHDGYKTLEDGQLVTLDVERRNGGNYAFNVRI